MTPEQLAARRKLFTDFEFYANNCLFIRTKEQTISPFRLNRAQKQLLVVINRQLETKGHVRLIILKGRQMGISTFIEGWLYFWVSQREAQRAIVVTHEAKATRNLLGMTKRFHKLVPEIMRPSTSYNSANELAFDKLDSSYAVATAGSDSVGRSDTITAAHLSELAFWPATSSRDVFSGLMDTIPNVPGTAVFMESTAEGVAGIFPEQWEAATKGESNFEAVFLPWFWDDGYCDPVPASFQASPEEKELRKLYDLSDGQLVFRRRKITEKGRDLFKQEYPCCAEEAFLTSGRPVFQPEQLHELLAAPPDPIAFMALEGDEFKTHSRGELTIFRKIDPSATYYIGADVGGGVDRDWSVAQVLDGEGNQCAVYRAQIEPAPYAHALEALGNLFGTAMICVESNNHGALTCHKLGTDLAYPNFYQEETYDKVNDTISTRLGFNTNVRSKVVIINELREAMRNRTCRPIDATTLTEMKSYIVTAKGGMEAEAGSFDDCVMALALANHINEGTFAPIVNQASWYVKMI